MFFIASLIYALTKVYRGGKNKAADPLQILFYFKSSPMASYYYQVCVQSKGTLHVSRAD